MGKIFQRIGRENGICRHCGKIRSDHLVPLHGELLCPETATFPQDDKKHTPPHGDQLFSPSLLRRAIEHVKNPDRQHQTDSPVLTTRAEVEAVGDPQPPVTYRIAFAIASDVLADAVIKIDIIRQTVGPTDLTLSFGWGLGGWGIERCAIIETATRHGFDVETFVMRCLKRFGQTCAYVNVDGAPWELDKQGHWSSITGEK